MKFSIVIGAVLLAAAVALLATGSYVVGAILLAVAVTSLSLLPFVGVLGGMGRAKRLQAHGIAASAEIQGLSQTGTFINEQPVVGFDLEVRAPGRPVQRVRHRQVVPHIALGSIAPGRLVGVLVDAADPQKLVIDWSSLAPNRISLDGGPEVDLAHSPGAAIGLRQLIASSGRQAHGQVDLRQDPELRARARAILQEHGVPLGAAQAVDKDSAAERLRELDQLRAAGLVSPQEHDEQRGRIIGGL